MRAGGLGRGSNNFMTHTIQNGVGRIICADGYKFTIFADAFAACTPVSNTGPWTHFEVRPFGMLDLSKRFDPWKVGLRYEGTRWCYVPAEVIEAEIEAHGGLK
jgi:hypothetical protein